jgi:hypothetical protein
MDLRWCVFTGWVPLYVIPAKLTGWVCECQLRLVVRGLIAAMKVVYSSSPMVDNLQMNASIIESLARPVNSVEGAGVSASVMHKLG